ncbi:M20/M25/M40 family metallo-hydrolase [Duganella sp. BJB488]|uniref:M20/M25/M40 family metallo-hydrolase n=1 Tax=unclassified Duganella TaxID=2636909 RepID=UPI000E34951D|nr:MULTISPECIES: M20/M25/M40 family metallo-hydrolase [unclassified Duganella]RFP13271.1 M20/M25/M40 family metallo-hydrolase [Duganella sp. BJB489]RFP17153.1 M20/M25/M40 family metallo-hydrolase [Duganella sp. BJB488]RFP31628.1 M20/M25/M40 family metallo-hydrolase [Duganella sp. BJB480]
MTLTPLQARLAGWIDDHFDAQVAFLQDVIRIPTDTPPGNNAPHAHAVAAMLDDLSWAVERHAVPEDAVRAYGMETITNLIVRRRYAAPGPTLALTAHGDVVPPGEGWTRPPYGGVIEDGRLYGRAAAVSKSDFATYVFAVRALEALGVALHGGVELHFTYDEEFGGLLGPGWLLEQGLSHPDFVIAAGFSYQIVTAHNACLQLEITVHGKSGHGAMPETGDDALQAATRILNAIYAQLPVLRDIRSQVPGITSPTMLVGRIDGGTNTNVVPGKVVMKVDRRMIPEEDPVAVEARLRALITAAVDGVPGIRIEIKRLLLSQALRPLPAVEPLLASLQRNAFDVIGEAIPAVGTPLYADARLYGAQGIPAVLYGAGPRTVPESNAKRGDEHLVLEDLRRATKVVAMTLLDFLQAEAPR